MSILVAPDAWSVEDYERDTMHVRSSGLRCLAEEGAAVYYGRYVARTHPSEQTAALRLGTLVHLAILEPNRYAREVMVGGPVNPKTGKHYGRDTNAFAQWAEAQMADGARQFVSDQEAAQVAAMREAFYGCPLAGQWVEQATAIEQARCWRDEPTGLLCKARPDIEAGHIVADVKTTANPAPEKFAWSAETYGYYGQAAHYVEGVAQLRGCNPSDLVFVLVVIESAWPWRVGIYELTHEEWVAAGMAWRRRWLDELAYRHNAEDWMSPWESKPMILSPKPGFERRVLPWTQ